MPPGDEERDLFPPRLREASVRCRFPDDGAVSPAPGSGGSPRTRSALSWTRRKGQRMWKCAFRLEGRDHLGSKFGQWQDLGRRGTEHARLDAPMGLQARKQWRWCARRNFSGCGQWCAPRGVFKGVEESDFAQVRRERAGIIENQSGSCLLKQNFPRAPYVPGENELPARPERGIAIPGRYRSSGTAQDVGRRTESGPFPSLP